MDKDRKRYQDPYNKSKIWEFTKLKGGFYLKQFISGKQYGKGIRVTKKKLDELGIANMKEVKPSTLETLQEYKSRFSKEKKTGVAKTLEHEL